MVLLIKFITVFAGPKLGTKPLPDYVQSVSLDILVERPAMI
jgi:hypothetical protein